jgi:hypothetical protein
VSGGYPYELAFNPDGSRLLVGHLNDLAGSDPARLTLYDANTLEPLQELDVSGLSDGKGGTTAARAAIGLAFSRSGKYVYAGIFANERGSQDEKVRRWLAADLAGEYRDFDTCSDQNTLQILPFDEDGAILLNASIPCTTFLDGEGAIVQRFQALTYPIDIEPLPAEDPGELLVSSSGESVFLRRAGARSGMRFDLGSRQLNVDVDPSAEERSALSGYTASAGQTQVSDWANTQSPRMNGLLMAVKDDAGLANNYAWAVDVARDGQFAVLGTSYFLAKYSVPERPDWSIALPAQVMRVNLTANENVVVSYALDGVMRWHNAIDGRILLSLIVDHQTERWLLWTPEGYFDGSPGADDLIGWHVNQGRERAPFWFGASRFHDELFRPAIVSDVIASIIDGRANRGEPTIVATQRLLNGIDLVRTKAPPVVRIANYDIGGLVDGELVVNVAFTLHSAATKKIQAFRVVVDGRTVVPVGSPFAPGAETRVTFPVRPNDEDIKIFAFSEDGWSHPAVLKVSEAMYRSLVGSASGLRGIDVLPQFKKPPRPNLIALVAGVDDYERAGGKLKTLCCATADARKFADFLRKQANSEFFDKVDVSVLTNEDATLANLQTQLSKLRRANKDDVILIFLAGHGVNDNFGKYYFVPYGVKVDPDTIENETLTGDRIAGTLEDSAARAILFMDTCSAGGALDRGFLGQVMNLQKNVVAYTSSKDGQPSQELANLGHGVFSYVLLEAAKGKALGGAVKEHISTYELSKYLYDEVRRITKGAQEPQHFGWGPDGPLPDHNLFKVVRD